MCRIAGIIDRDIENLQVDCIRMRDSMKHGGPDQAGIYCDESASLVFGFRRLAIIDLCETGNQPMLNENEDVVLIFNGEIYNYLTLKEELINAGFAFKSTSDTEVILRSYQLWGTGCFSKFRGMFSIALYDKKRGELILARDHAGIKPLYFFCDEKSLYFASEIRAFKEVKSEWEENPEWKVYFLTYGYLPHPVTTLKGVKPLEKGSYRVFNIHTFQSKQFFFYQDDYTEEVSNLDEARELIQHSLISAVKRHLIADAPIGLFLSGGIDSSLLTLLAKPYKKELHTLSIIFDDKNYSEKQYQEIIVEKVQSFHQSFLLNKELFVNALPDILSAMDQPSADGINSYFISRFAKEAGLKAVLSGLGADEFFGGYASFKRGGLIKKLQLVPDYFLHAARLLPQDKYRKVSFLKNKDAIGEYLFNRGYYTSVETAELLEMNESEVDSLLDNITIPSFVNGLSIGNKASFLESNLYMESQLLKDTDAMSMWHSVEVRGPFLDYDLIKAIQKVDTDLKFKQAQSKFLLVDSFKDILPEEIWNRKKQGFVFPFDVWMKDNLESLMPERQNKKLNRRFQSGRLSWSRYWTYLVSQIFKA